MKGTHEGKFVARCDTIENVHTQDGVSEGSGGDSIKLFSAQSHAGPAKFQVIENSLGTKRSPQ